MYEIIRDYFISGIEIDPEIIHFAESTLGYPDLERGETVLGSEDLFESGLVELIITPGIPLRTTLEEHIPDNGAEQSQIDGIAKGLSRDVNPVTLTIRENRVSSVDIPGRMFRQFVGRLHLGESRIFPVPEGPAREQLYELSALLRSFNMHLTENRREYIQEFIERSTNQSLAMADQKACLLFLGGLFSKYSSIARPDQLIADRKKYWNESIKQIERFHENAEKYSMEFMMMQRISPPPVSMDEAEEQIRIITLIESTHTDK